MSTIKERLLGSLLGQREDINKKLLWWNDKNIPNPQLEIQLMNIDMRIDNLMSNG